MAAKSAGGNTKPDAAEPEKRRGRRPRPVVCVETGTVYAGAKDAAKLCGIERPANIGAAIRNNTASGGFHWAYAQDLEPDAPLLRAPTTQASRAVACWETGEVFPSAREAAHSVGVDVTSRITTAIARRATAGGYHWYWADEPKPDASELTDPSSVSDRPVVCWETGEAFPNIATAAEVVGVRKKYAISTAVEHGNKAGGYHWYWQDQPKPAASEIAADNRRPVVCLETGKVYESGAKAAASVGLKNPYSIVKAIKGKGTAGGFHWFYQDQPRPDASELVAPKSRAAHHSGTARKSRSSGTAKKPRPVVCIETGEAFESAADAAAAVGLSAPVHIYRVIKSGEKAGGYHWRYYGSGRKS